MKRKLLVLTIASVLFALAGCQDKGDRYPAIDDPETPVGPKGDAAVYTIKQLLQCDPANPQGINIADKFDFFEGLKLKLWFTDGEAHTMEFTNGDRIPFYPFDFEVPAGKIECVLDETAEPAELRIKATDQLIAVKENGALTISFHLDSKLITYKYKLRTEE